MEKIKNKSFLFYAIAFFLILINIIITNFIEISELTTIILLLISCLLIYIGGYFYFKSTGNKKVFKFNLYLFFGMYLILLLYFLFFNHWWNRSAVDVEMNLEPFSTIKMYLKDFDSIMENKPILNLLGNFICLMPLSFFLKYLFEKQNNIFIFLITLLLLSVGIEFMQYLSKTGSFDIDDIMLNSSGALLMYILLKIKSIDLLIKNILFFENNKISKKSLILIICFVVLIITLFISIYKYRQKLFEQRKLEYEEINRPTITFKYDNKCSNNNLFYEDETYKYYFTCYDKDKFYAIVNGQDKLSIKNLLDNSKYNTTIDVILSIMDYQNIEYKIEDKYPNFLLEIKNPNNENISFPTKIDSNIAKLIITDQSKNNVDLQYNVNIVPKKNGSEIINIDFELADNNGQITKKITKKVEIKIDENLNIKYNIIK